MTHAPPVPEAATSPYPIQEPPHAHPTPVYDVAPTDDDEQDGGIALPSLPIVAALVAGAAAVGAAAYALLGRDKPAPKRRRKR